MLTYDTYVSTMATMTVIASSNADFQVALPNAIDYSEGRIYRDLDLINLMVRDSSASTTANMTPA